MVKKIVSNSPKFIKNALTNKYVLYLVLIVSIGNILGYIEANDFDALALFMASGFVMSYFSKNMTVNTLVALNLANCKVCADYITDYMNFNVEGFKEGAKDKSGRKKKNSKYYKDKNGNCVEHTEQSKKDGGCSGAGCKKNCKTCYDSIQCS